MPQTIKLRTGVCLVPEHNPLLLAKQVATLDNFSGGRFLSSIGAGRLNEETTVMGGDFAHRWGQTREAILSQSIEVVAMPVPADPNVFKAYEDAGTDGAVVLLMPATEQEMLSELEQIAQQVLP